MVDQSEGMLRKRGILTREELAIEFNIKVQTVNDWQRDGMPTIKQGMTVLYDLDEIIAWMRKQTKRTKRLTKRAA